jgi:hypothetical protein
VILDVLARNLKMVRRFSANVTESGRGWHFGLGAANEKTGGGPGKRSVDPGSHRQAVVP